MTNDEGMTKSDARDARADDSFWDDGAGLVREEPETKRVYGLEEWTARFGETSKKTDRDANIQRPRSQMPSSFGLHYSFVIGHSAFVILPHMTPARFQTIEEIFRAALDQEPDEINAFLDTACEGDEPLRRKVEALLASRQRAGNFIETSAVGIATKIIENGQPDLLAGRTIGHYKLSERIGTGGMGDVYLATDITAGRKAALKLLPTRFTGDAERLKRFQQEAHAVVALNHPNILTVYEIGE